jgi:ribosomal protein L34E
MFRSSPADSAQDARLQQLLGMVTEEFFAVDRTAAGLDFATIEQRAHQAGRKVARLLSEQAASQCAESAEREQPCPDCGQPCAGIVEGRPLEARDGPISLKEARHACPRCRRVFFPQSTAPGPGSPSL